MDVKDISFMYSETLPFAVLLVDKDKKDLN